MPNGFYFVSHAVDKKRIFFAGFDRNYDEISIELTIHRHSKYYLRLINWPASILALLTLTIFFLPPSAFERLLYGNRNYVYQRILDIYIYIYMHLYLF